MMKLLSNLFSGRTKSPSRERQSNVYADILSDGSSSGGSMFYPSPSRTTVQRIELKRPCVDALLEKQLQLEETFRIIDKNGDGKISQQELADMWANVGEEVTQEEVRLMIEEADADGDGEIDLMEFFDLCRNMDVGNDPAKHVDDLRDAFNVADADGDGFLSAEELQKVPKRLGKRKIL